jgi:hypothetical protein
VQLLWQTASKLLLLVQQQQQQQQQQPTHAPPLPRPTPLSTVTAAAATQAPAAAVAAAAAQQQQQQQQLARLGLSAAAPRHSIYDKLHTLKPARLPTRKALQYENCRILSPEGVGLATCGLKKVCCLEVGGSSWGAANCLTLRPGLQGFCQLQRKGGGERVWIYSVVWVSANWRPVQVRWLNKCPTVKPC